ncbi:hypothetical protein JCM3775_005451 [Rhodotorula graminis]
MPAEQLAPHDTPRPTGLDELPAAVDLLSLGEDKPVTGWNRLPVELKKRIVYNVLDLIEDEEAPQDDDSMVPVTVGFFARKEISDKERMMSVVFRVHQLKRLESLNRELRDICAPLSWENVGFGDFDKAALERLEEVLAPHASHVRLVGFGSASMTACCGMPLEVSDARARDKAASRVFRLCHNVEEVAVTEPRQQPDGVFQLEHLRTATVATSSYGARDFAFLERQPHLESLFVHSKAPPLASDSIKLAESLSRFAHLKNLRIKGTRLVSTAFLERAVAIPSPLESIELVSAEADISFEALAAFLVKFSSTLVSLDLNLGDADSPDLWTVDDGTSLELPHLKTLGVGTDFDSIFFCRLSSPAIPLSFFRLDFFPSIVDDPSDLLAFLRAHASTLERVYLSREALLATDHWNESHDCSALEPWVVAAIVQECDELGIECGLGVEGCDGRSADESDEDEYLYTDDEYLYTDDSRDDEDSGHEHPEFEIRVWTEPRTGSTALEQLVRELVRSGRVAVERDEGAGGGEDSDGERSTGGSSEVY